MMQSGGQSWIGWLRGRVDSGARSWAVCSRRARKRIWNSACDHTVTSPLMPWGEQWRWWGKCRTWLQLSLSVVWCLPLHGLRLVGSLRLWSGQSLLVRLVGSLASLTSWLHQSIQLRSGVSYGIDGSLGRWLSSSLPTVITAAIVHRATGRGWCGQRRDTSHCYTSRAATVATDGAGGLWYGRIGGDDRSWSGVGWGQRWADMMVMLGVTWNPTIHDLIVALLALR